MITVLRDVVENTDTRLGRAFDISIQILIALSVVSFSIETIPSITEQTRSYLSTFEVISVAIFTLEYIARVICAEERKRFVFSFFGVVDFLSIAPFYLALGIDLRSLRTFRLLRLVRILKLARYNAAMRRFHRAFLIAKEELALFLFATLIILYLAGVGIYYFENPAQPYAFSSVFHSLWWAVATLTTVGYGDIYPITIGGKIFTFFILIIGLGIVSIPAGMVASALAKARELDDE